MRLVTFSHAGATRVGVCVDDEIVDLAAAAPALPREMLALLEAGRPALEAAEAAAAGAARRLASAEVRLEAPVRPRKCLAIGLNYADHVAETGAKKPEFPMFFTKQVTCITGPFDPIHYPRATSALDYEGELAFVVGRRCRHVPKQRAAEMIAGFMVMNDVSVRDWQARSPTLMLGKSWDTHGPIGPWIATPDEVGDPHALGIRTFVNGELRQDSNTKHLIFDCFDQLAILSTVMTLEPGDVVTTGTPGGVGIASKPPRLLRPGDVVRIEIERIGAIENSVIAEPADTARG